MSDPAASTPSDSAMQVFGSSAALASELSAQLRSLSAQAVQARGAFHVAISGGSLPSILADALLAPPDAGGVRAPLLDTSAWHWWWADERCVSRGDKDSNFAEAQKQIFKHLPPIAAERMHAIDEQLVDKPEQAAAAYERDLRSVLGGGSLDVALLGMGPDGHCCSLFPGHPLLQESARWIAPITDSPKPPPQRITMTLPLLAQAGLALFVVTGAGKAEALSTVVRQRKAGPSAPDAAEHLPCARVQAQKTVFLADKEAAAKLESRL